MKNMPSKIYLNLESDCVQLCSSFDTPLFPNKFVSCNKTYILL